MDKNILIDDIAKYTMANATMIEHALANRDMQMLKDAFKNFSSASKETAVRLNFKEYMNAPLKEIISDEQTKRKLLIAIRGLKKIWCTCSDLFHSFCAEDINKYIAEEYPFKRPFDEINVPRWIDATINNMQLEDYDIEANQSKFEMIDSAFSRFRNEYYMDKGTLSEELSLLNYKGLPAVVYYNAYDDYYLVAYIKDGALHIENDRGESIFDYEEENGWSKDDLLYMKYGVHANELDAFELEGIDYYNKVYYENKMAEQEFEQE